MKNKTFILTFMLYCLANTTVYAELYNRAPSILPGSQPEWRDPTHWIGKMNAPDNVMLSSEEIVQKNSIYNENIRKPDPFNGLSKERTPNLDHWWPGYVLFAPDVYTMSAREVAATVKEHIQIQIDYLRRSPYANVSAIEYSDEDINAFEREMAIDAVPNECEVKRGIAVTTTLVRNVPTPTPIQIGLQENGERRFDMFNVCLLKIGNPVAVLHASLSGEFVLVLTGEAYGWVKSEDIALSNQVGINRFAKPNEFVVCTGDRVMFYGDESCTTACGYFRMGDRLPVTSDNNKRHIERPVRMSNGQLIYETAWLREDADVSFGWLPYTRRNIVETAFKLLDNAYDFTGGYLGRNHETTYRDIFACFGFELPWHGSLFTLYSQTDSIAMPDPKNDSKNQFKTILTHEPFVTVFCAGGHAQLLLGDEDGIPVVFDNHGYQYTAEDGTAYMVKRTCVGRMTNPGITGYMLTRPLTISKLK